MLEHAQLYFIPSHGEFLKIQPGTGDNLTPEDVANGYTDYVIWNRLKPECLDIDGETLYTFRVYDHPQSNRSQAGSVQAQILPKPPKCKLGATFG